MKQKLFSMTNHIIISRLPPQSISSTKTSLLVLAHFLKPPVDAAGWRRDRPQRWLSGTHMLPRIPCHTRPVDLSPRQAISMLRKARTTEMPKESTADTEVWIDLPRTRQILWLLWLSKGSDSDRLVESTLNLSLSLNHAPAVPSRSCSSETMCKQRFVILKSTGADSSNNVDQLCHTVQVETQLQFLRCPL